MRGGGYTGGEEHSGTTFSTAMDTLGTMKKFYQAVFDLRLFVEMEDGDTGVVYYFENADPSRKKVESALRDAKFYLLMAEQGSGDSLSKRMVRLSRELTKNTTASWIIVADDSEQVHPLFDELREEVHQIKDLEDKTGHSYEACKTHIRNLITP